jgi:hypothetical protein
MKKLTVLLLLIGGSLLTSCEKETTPVYEDPVQQVPENEEDLLKRGSITFKIQKVKNPNKDQQDAYAKINAAMSLAVKYFNQFTNRSRVLTVQYDPSVNSADAGIGGNIIRFGKGRQYMNVYTAMHELHHIFGVGGASWRSKFNKKGHFTGANVNKVMKKWGNGGTNNIAQLHFWPFQFNGPKEFNPNHLEVSARISEAYRLDGV